MRRYCHTLRLCPCYAVALTLGLLCSSGPLFAWEADVHYGLTKWLAIKAGFNPQSAETLAQATQEPDDGWSLPALHVSGAMLTESLFGNSTIGASRLIRRHHYPSFWDVPKAPGKRKVFPGDLTSRKLVDDEISRNISSASAAQLSDNLVDFGYGLHRFQDSWAHQGVPDSPFRPAFEFLSDRSWGHPEARFGWPFHDADLTYRFQDDAEETARETFSTLKAFLSRTGSAVWGRPTPVSWPEIRPEVFKFVRAKSKPEKAEWFKANLPGFLNNRGDTTNVSLNQKEVISKITLPGLLPGIPIRDKVAQAMRPVASGPDTIPVEVRDLVSRFLNIWIVQQRIEEAIFLVDLAAVKKEVLALRQLGEESPLIAEPMDLPPLNVSQNKFVARQARKLGFSKDQRAILVERVAAGGLTAAAATQISTEMSRWRLNREQVAMLARKMEARPLNRAELAWAVADIRESKIGNPETLKWLRKFLTSWLVVDHGLVNLRGHCIPGTDGYIALPETPLKEKEGFKFLKYEELGEAVGFPGGSEPFHLEKSSGRPEGFEGDYVATFRFYDKPYDALFLAVGQSNGEWKVVGMYWIAG